MGGFSNLDLGRFAPARGRFVCPAWRRGLGTREDARTVASDFSSEAQPLRDGVEQVSHVYALPPLVVETERLHQIQSLQQ